MDNNTIQKNALENLSKKKKGKTFEGAARFNRVKPFTNVLLTILFIIIAIVAVAPAVLTMIISLTDSSSIASKGYSFFPSAWSLQAYVELWNRRAIIGQGFLVSISLTVAGTVIGLILNTLIAYPLSRRTFKLRGFYTWLIFIPMLFNGGMVASYIINTNVLGLKNSFFALLLPLACSSWYIIILRTFFQTTVPDEIIESGKIDGASQLRIFAQIVLPISLPALATIGLFLAFAYWNDWFQARLYIDSNHTQLFPLQFLLIMIDENIRFLLENQSMVTSTDSAVTKLPTEGIRMAICMVVVIPIACAYPFFQKYFISGLTIGAVKG